MWRAYLGDTLSGAVGEPIDLPETSWTLSVSDSSLAIVRDKGVGGAEASGLCLPWASVPGATREAKARAIAPYRRSLFVCWEDATGSVPVVAGAVGPRVDGWYDTSFELVSMASLLSQRIAFYEGTFGMGKQPGTTDATASYTQSLRGIAAELGYLATAQKPGGALPIDWSYEGERGRHSRTYYGFNAHNNDFTKLLGDITNVIGGPDAQLRPYWDDEGTHIRHRLLMGTDAHPELDQTGLVHTLTCFPGGGTVENVRVAHTAPVMRVYAHGAGEDKAMLTYLAEDLTLAQRSDPWPLLETAASFSDDESLDVLRKHADQLLQAGRRPLAQVVGEIWLDDPHVPPLAEIWPGMLCHLSVEGHPGLPDGTYALRVMEMAGDSTPRVTVTFDPILDPWEA